MNQRAKPPRRAGPDHVDRLRAQWSREVPDLDTEPMAVLGRIVRLAELLRPSIETTLAGHGLDRGEFDVLAALRRSGKPFRLTPTELYRSLLISSGSLTHRLARLQAAGLIERKPSADDGRSLLVVLTRKGRARVETAFRADMANEQRFLTGLHADQRAKLEHLLRELTGSVESASSGESPGD